MVSDEFMFINMWKNIRSGWQCFQGGKLAVGIEDFISSMTCGMKIWL